MTHEITDQQLEKVLHHTFLLALRVIYSAHNLDVGLSEDPAWGVLREIADGTLQVMARSGDALGQHATPAMRDDAIENANQIITDDRTIARAILTDRERLDYIERETGSG